MPGLLIVNADDFGFSRRVTESALQAFRAGAISSATAMVWMRDSGRAASTASELGLPLGLHLNLTAEFTSTSVPAAARSRQRKLVEHLGRRGEGGVGRNAGRVVGDAVRDQLERLAETYGEPTHVDGHHHVHLKPEVMKQIPDRFPIRPPLSVLDGGSAVSRQPVPGRRSPRWALSLEQIRLDLGAEGAGVLTRADHDAIEVMTHPAENGQLRILLGHRWQEMIAGLRMGSYADLP